jgi:enoyl-CoA hydratase/carnithine racemase
MPEVGVTRFSATGGLGELVIERPHKRNAICAEVLEDIAGALEQCRDDGHRVLVLSGGGRFFSSGADLDEVTGSEADVDWFHLIGQVTARLASADVVSIAAVEGGCLGSGLDLASACDLRVAAADAFFGLPTLDMGLVYRPETFRRIAAVAGPTALMRLTALGECIDATEAARLGLVTRLADDPVAEARAIGERLASLPSSALLQTVHMIGEITDSVSIPDRWLRSHGIWPSRECDGSSAGRPYEPRSPHRAAP